MLAGVMARWSEAPPKEVEKAAISILLLLSIRKFNTNKKEDRKELSKLK